MENLNCIFNDFTNLFSLSKTLRFALLPVGKTDDILKNKGLVREDEKISEQYKKAKKIIDAYHKDFIEKSLAQISLEDSDFSELTGCYEAIRKDNKKDELKENLKKTNDRLRKKIAREIQSTPNYKRIFSKELIKEDLPAWIEKAWEGEDMQEKKETIESFKNFTTYFSGFNENRKNMYTGEEHSTAIAYRIIHENLPKFLENSRRFQELIQKFPEITEDFESIKQDLSDEIEDRSVEDFFTSSYFNQCLSQEGIDRYNTLIGGKSVAGESTRRQGINEKINLYRQTKEARLKNAGEEEKQILKKQISELRNYRMVALYKQILSDRVSHSFLPEKFESDQEVLDSIQNFYKFNYKEWTTDNDLKIQIPQSLQSILRESLKEADPNKIYIKNNTFLKELSRSLYGHWGLINDALEAFAEQKFPQEGKTMTKKLADARENWVRKTPYFTIADLEQAILDYLKSNPEVVKKEDYLSSETPIINYFQTIKMDILSQNDEHPVTIDPFEKIENTYNEILPILETPCEKGSRELMQEKEKVEKIKNFLENFQNLLHFIKPLYVAQKGKRENEGFIAPEKDAGFYTDFDPLFEQLQNTIVPLYNKVRNYMTQKPFRTEKFKLNFQNSTLLNGWDKNKETDNTSVLLIKDGLYYLAVMDKRHNKIFKDIPESDPTGEVYQKMEYKLLPGASKMLPKVFFSAKNIDDYNPSEEILRIRNHASHTKSGTPQKGYEKKEFNEKDCRTMIDFFKDSIKEHPEWKNFGFRFSPTNEYKDMSQFYREVENQGYKISYVPVSKNYIDQMVEEEKLYLFKIYSKDFSQNKCDKNKNASPNLHTLYWKALFDEKNLQNVVFKLNGEAEIFFRPASIQYDDSIWQTGHHAKDPKKKQPYPIIKDRRYAENRFLFHVPLTMNFKAEGISKFNDRINEFLKDKPEVHILSIDRGERHLAYYTLIDQKGVIKKQGSLNNPTGREKDDYRHKLDEKEKQRDKARKSWGSIEKIKDLKEGYLSIVVHEIAKMVVEYNAIVVFEDLNFGFKRGRFKVEKQIYQKLEKMLIDKLNYLVFKDRLSEKPGGVLNGLQLAAPFEGFKYMGKQTGIIYYVPAYHTSKICPLTGFVNLLYPKYESIGKAKNFFEKFDSIRYNSQKDYFEFAFQYANFTDKAEGSKQDWVLCSHGMRLSNFRDPDKNHQWSSKEVDVTEELKTLLKENRIDYHSGEDLKNRIIQKEDTPFFKSLIYYLRLILQMRNSVSGTDEDWMISPVANANGNFFDSTKVTDNSLPTNADANGAYHIGLKGLWILNQINTLKEGKKLNLSISNKEWYGFAQKKPYQE